MWHRLVIVEYLTIGKLHLQLLFVSNNWGAVHFHRSFQLAAALANLLLSVSLIILP